MRQHTAKTNGKFKGGEIHHYDPELMMGELVLNFLKNYKQGSISIEVPKDWREQFDKRYSINRIVADRNRKAERDRIKAKQGIF